MTGSNDGEAARGFNRRAFMGGAAGAAALPLVAKAADTSCGAPVASDPSLPVDVTLKINGSNKSLKIDARTPYSTRFASTSVLPARRRAATTANAAHARST
jgi:hypothetical protein